MLPLVKPYFVLLT